MKVTVDEYWIRFGNPRQSSSFTGNLSGKYLFFSPSLFSLMRIAVAEIKRHGFKVAKISTIPRNGERVLCLYWIDDSRKYELALRYRRNKNINYRYWKSNADTRAGKYSNKFLYGQEN